MLYDVLYTWVLESIPEKEGLMAGLYICSICLYAYYVHIYDLHKWLFVGKDSWAVRACQEIIQSLAILNGLSVRVYCFAKVLRGVPTNPTHPYSIGWKRN